MRVLVVTHYFPPETGAPQARLSELAALWAAAGDDVAVLTGMPNHPTGVVPAEYRGRSVVDERVDGYRVVRTWLYATPNQGVARKTLSHLSFALTGPLLGGRRVGPADVVMVSSPTFFSIFAAWYLARRTRARLVVEVRDLWPAIFVELGVLENRVLIGALERAELAAYRAADAVVVVTEGFRDNLVSRQVPAAKVHVVPNGVDLARFAADAADGAAKAAEAAGWRDRLGAAPGDTLVLYVGAHGISHGLTAVAETAAKLAGEPVRFGFVGEGAAKGDLERRVAELGLENVVMLPGIPRDAVPGLLAAADICLVPLRRVPLFDTFIPSKLFEYLAAGRAVIGSVRGEAAAILRGAGAVVVEPEDSAALADAVRALAGDPERRAEMGRQGRDFVAAHYDRRALADRYRAILGDVAGRR
ncbi:MAG: glycosyltransferase family 4 protein [Acidimicrobiales bacterium]